MYAHFACGFVKDGIVHARTEELLRRLAARNGWFVPVSTLLAFFASNDLPRVFLCRSSLRWNNAADL
ncbi:hypothetical protein BDD14_0222 [Edaphobacter modestus]|uniref:Uncharacterized protein n=1 Tax=Edaphobacter modestus TaxID=388466 RepID=A0A4Q7YPD2_9BACT|nr:hypothetical protein BDD14_0222 [Edaphobacter modestus]